jgi:hypothetical protein
MRGTTLRQYVESIPQCTTPCPGVERCDHWVNRPERLESMACCRLAVGLRAAYLRGLGSKNLTLPADLLVGASVAG